MGRVGVILGRAALDLLFDAQLTFDFVVRRDQVRGVHVKDDLFSRVGLDATASTARTHDALGNRWGGTDRYRVTSGHRSFAHDLLVVGQLVGLDVALVDPDLNANATGVRTRLTKAVVDVGAQRVQRHSTFTVGLTT